MLQDFHEEVSQLLPTQTVEGLREEQVLVLLAHLEEEFVVLIVLIVLVHNHGHEAADLLVDECVRGLRDQGLRQIRPGATPLEDVHERVFLF